VRALRPKAIDGVQVDYVERPQNGRCLASLHSGNRKGEQSAGHARLWSEIIKKPPPTEFSE